MLPLCFNYWTVSGYVDPSSTSSPTAATQYNAIHIG
jgi:hypothetical protein